MTGGQRRPPPLPSPIRKRITTRSQRRSPLHPSPRNSPSLLSPRPSPTLASPRLASVAVVSSPHHTPPLPHTPLRTQPHLSTSQPSPTKRSPLQRSPPQRSPKYSSKGFSFRDQRLPASPPVHPDANSSGGIMATIRARTRDALHRLFGTNPAVLNAPCAECATCLTAKPMKRARHVEGVKDQVVPEGSNEEGSVGAKPETCSCQDSLWQSGGFGPELMLRTAEELSARILSMYAKAIEPGTSNVDYSLLVRSQDFGDYLLAARKLRYFDPLLLNHVERKAFFLNVYNSLMIHAIAVLPKPATKFERISLYNTASYDIGGRPYSLNMIEHGVLRSNSRGAGPFAQPPFADSDARIQCILPTIDPRIHFALNCGARSCPAVRFYDATTIDKTLNAATKAYLAALEVDVENRVVTLPKLLQWYKADFAGNGDVDDLLQWTLPYLDPNTKKNLSALLQEKKDSLNPFKVVYSSYDWTVNDSSL